ncbi:putative phage abortive infection protein [Serratia marcescens]
MNYLVLILITLAINLCALYFLASYDLSWPFTGWDREELGQFGDSWGVLTSIFSVFAFCGVAYSVVLQRKSLEQVTIEANENRTFLRLQQFESAFFQMLNLLQNIISDMDINFEEDGKAARKGRDVFHFLYKRLKRNGFLEAWFQTVKHGRMIDFEQLGSNAANAYNSFYKERQRDLAHYYRMVYHIFKFIDESGFDERIRTKYANIMRAQLSNYELLMLFYNCIGKYGANMEKYAIRYKIFDNMPIDELIFNGHKYLVDPRAFGSQSVYTAY